MAVATIGLTTIRSEFAMPETLTRLEAAIAEAGMTVFARIDHGAAAATAHLSLGPTKLVIFGNAKGGTRLMQASQALGIDLPLKALVYCDASHQVWLAFNDPHWIAERHTLGQEVATTVAMMAGALETIFARATKSLIED
jgi:uncharacterized protein (DUF302 family)